MTLSVQLGLLEGAGLIGLGHLEEAEALLLEARAEADARQGQSLKWGVLTAQAQVAERRGDDALAAQLRHQARDAVEALAAQLTDPVLRAGFLNRTDVRGLVAAAQGAESVPQ